mgnify:CR=1 FL=1
MIHLERLQAGLGSAIEAIVSDATVAWSPSQLPREQARRHLVTLQRLSGGHMTDDPTPRTTPVPTSATITVTGNPANARAVQVLATGARWRVIVPAATSNADLRDAIQAALSALGKSLDATLTPAGADAIVLTPANPAALHGITVRGSALLSDTTSLAKVTQGWESSRVQVSCSSADRTTAGGAHALAQTIRGALRRPSVTRLLDEYGIGLWDVGQVIDHARKSGSAWESHATLDLHVVQLSLDAELVPAAQSVAASVNADPQTIEIEVSP